MKSTISIRTKTMIQAAQVVAEVFIHHQILITVQLMISLRSYVKCGKMEIILVSVKLSAEKINDAVSSFTDYISWDHIGGKITQFVNGFCELFNSLIATINWENVGKMFGTGINTIANTLYLLLNGIDWQRIGQALAEGLNGLVHTVDWTKLGATIGSYLQARIDALYGFVTTGRLGRNW